MHVKHGLRRLSATGVLPLIAMLLLAPALRAQVAGAVRDSASQLPLPSTAVMVLDPTGRAVSRGMTDAQGHFRLATTMGKTTGKAAPKTVYPLRLRVLRMGFRPREIALTPASAGTYFDIGLVSFPIKLEEVQIVAVTCPKRPDRAQALSLLREVRMSLLANVVARSQSSATMKRLLFERRFEGASGRVADQTVRTRITSSTTEQFSAARSAAAFSRQGFVEDSTGAHTYLGPDAETLVDDAFAERYCFKVAPPDRARPLQVGLGFEPVDREDGRIDIVGTVWIDTLSRVLRDLNFHYVGLDQQTSALSPEGRLSFRELSNGVVIIDQWSLRLGGERRQTGGRTLVGRTPEVSAIAARERPQEIGGEIARASWPDGYSWEAPLGTIRLRAVDGQGRPATGSVVQLLDTDYQATTDASGTFVLSDLLPGPYTASVRDPHLAALDVPSTTTLRLSVVRDSTIDARVVVESADDFVMRRCGYDAGIAGRARLLGRVVTADGRPATEAKWTMRDEFGTVLVESGRVDGDGFFHSCQLPMNRSVTIDVWQNDRRSNASRPMTDALTTLRVVLPP